jgi:hypothetical protein
VRTPEKTFNGLRNFDGYSETTLLTDMMMMMMMMM